MIDAAQRRKLEKIWFVFGNDGTKSSDSNHKFIQRILDAGVDYRLHYHPSQDCIEAVDKILMNSNQD